MSAPRSSSFPTLGLSLLTALVFLMPAGAQDARNRDLAREMLRATLSQLEEQAAGEQVQERIRALLSRMERERPQGLTDREVAGVRERIRIGRREAEKLQDAGRLEQAAKLLEELELLEERIQSGERRQERDPPQGREAEEIMHGLHQGMGALRALGRMDALEMLERITAELERDLARGRARREDERRERPVADRARRREVDREREIAEGQLQILRMAVRVLTEERPEAAGLVRRALRAREVGLEGRRDAKAQEIRAAAPNLGNQAEALMLAARLLREMDQGERAQMVYRHARQLAERASARRAAPREDNSEIRAARRQVEIMQVALRALAEADREDAAALLEHAIHARQLALEGRRDREAAEIREEAPGRGAQAELLGVAARILAEMDQPDRAEMVADYSRQLADQARAIRLRQSRSEDRDERERPRRERDENRADEDRPRLRRLEERAEELSRAIEELRAAVRAIRRERNRD